MKLHLFNKQKTETKELSIFKTHKDKIYPWIKHFSKDDNTNDNEKVIEFSSDNDFPIYQEWLADLAIFYVVDLGDMYQMILKRELPTDMTIDDLHQIAISNLTNNIEYKIYDTTFGGHMLAAGGNHEANAICLEFIWTSVAEGLTDDLVVGIPSKDLVFIVPQSNLDKIFALKEYVLTVSKDCEKPLTKNIFSFNRLTKKWAIFEEQKSL